MELRPLIVTTLLVSTTALPGQSLFVRGDADSSGSLDISDPIASFGFLFLGAPEPACLDAADADDSGVLDITDPVFLLGFLYLGSKEPPPPGPYFAGRDPTPDALGCRGASEAVHLIESSPANGEEGVAITRETILRFSGPLDAQTINAEAIRAEFGGAPLAARLHASPDGRTVTLFWVPPLPASARVRVTVDGDFLRDQSGMKVDADRDGLPGGAAAIDFDTLSLTTLPGTAVYGRVFASELATTPAGGGVNEPLEGVLVTVDGMEASLRAYTDHLGNFRLDPAPAGAFFVHVHGYTATNPVPRGAYFPYVGKRWRSVPGQAIDIGDVYLPVIAPGTLQEVSATEATTITLPAAVLAEHPELEGVTIVVPPDAAFADDGTRGGRVGIAPVPADRLPGKLPPGLEFPIVITVQTDNAANFDTPVPACFPNLPDPATGQPLAPGTKNWLYSFNHDVGEFEAVGPMTVSADGRLICTDPGTGILAPGWHGSGPVPITPLDPCASSCCSPNDGGSGGPLGGGAGGGGAGGETCDDNCNPVAGNSCVIAVCTQLKTECDWCDKNAYNPRARTSRQKIEKSDGSWYDYCARRAEELRDDRAIDCVIQSGLECPDPFPLDCEDSNCCPLDVRAKCQPKPGGGGAGPDDALQQVRLLLAEIRASLAPFGFDVELPPEETARIDELFARADELAEGDIDGLITGHLIENERRAAALEATLPFRRGGNAPPYPVLYLAEALRADGSILELRGKTGPGGRYSLFVPRDGEIRRVAFYDPRTRRIAMETPLLTAAPPAVMPPFNLRAVPADLEDYDGDSLADVVEFIYGTDPGKRDSDSDGVADGAEVDQGTDPLDGLPARTGIIATADTPGTAVDVCAVNDLAVVADLERGISVFNVFNGMDPTIVAQVETPGTAQAVACAGSLVAVADGEAGLAVIDIADPPAARIRHQIALGGSAWAVAAAGGIAYAGLVTGPRQLAAVDLPTGTVLARSDVGGAVHDVAIEGDTLFVLLYGELRAYRLDQDLRTPVDAAPLSGFQPEGITRRRRLFVGGGIAYATSYPGYDTFDVRDPSALARVGSAVDAGPNSFKAIALNGSGLGVAAVGLNPRNDGTHDIWLYDTSSPALTNAYLTQFATPGLARALSIYNGLAYVADGGSGLQVINYLRYDARGLPPKIALSTSSALDRAEEGQSYRVSAQVSDDVQVRNVEFYLDDSKLSVDGNFPFEHRFVTPLLSRQPRFTLRAKATDTGGNATWSEVLTVMIAPDAMPPRVTRLSPPAGSISGTGALAALSATFNEPISAATLTSQTVRLFSSGDDGLVGTGDDEERAGGVVSYRDATSTVLLTFAAPLPPALYRAWLGPGVADLTGNRLAAEFAWTFRVYGFTDTDSDGVPDDIEPLLGLDPRDGDSDSDGVPDGAEDFDGDGLPNAGEAALGSQPTDPDTDGDGTLDGAEDTDQDGLTDGAELASETDPLKADSDADGWPDGAEVDAGSDPRRLSSLPPAIHVAAPRVSIALPEWGSGQGSTITVAAPPVSIAFPGAGQAEGADSTITIGKPPVSMKINR